MARRAGRKGAGTPRRDGTRLLRESGESGWLRGYVFLGSSILIAGVFLYTHMLTVRLERQAQAMSRVLADFCASVTLEAVESEGLREVFRQVRHQIDFPVVLTDQLGRPYAWQGIGISPDSVTVEMSQAIDPHHPPTSGPLAEILSIIRTMDTRNPPVPMMVPGTEQVVGYVHYGESALLREVRWVPVVQMAAFFLFIALGFLGFRSAKLSEQRFIWIGMAKETAHQLGTPISSLMGWVELLRSRAAPAGEDLAQVTVSRKLFQETVTEMESDVERLNKIAFRFSQVGSEPQRKLQEIVPVVAGTVTYMRRRLPRLGSATTIAERYEEVPPLNVNAELIEWVIENLLKNAVDASAGKENRIAVTVERRPESETVEIRVADSGRGMTPAEQRRVFEPGFTTKTRGWGLGLTLARRIIEEYHGGRIWVKESEQGKGTTMAISFPI
jgi:two-component system, NtrC family, sensor histidine kinase KinB